MTKISSRELTSLDSGWYVPKNSFKLLLVTESPLSVKDYNSNLGNANQKLTSEILTNAKFELDLIKNSLDYQLLGSDIIAENILNAVRVIEKVETGESAYTFYDLAITKKWPKQWLIIVLFCMLGFLIGILFVALRQNLRSNSNFDLN